MTSIEVLTWAIGLGVTLLAALMAVMWSYILRQGNNLYAYITKTSDELKKEVEKMGEQARIDSDKHEERFARKDEMIEVKSTVSAVRGEMNNQFTALNMQMGGIATQMSNIVTMLTKK